MTSLGIVADWMTREPVAVPEETPLSEVLRLMQIQEIRHVLVMQGARLSGIFSSRDTRRLLGADRRVPTDVAVGTLMTEDPVTVSPHAPLLDAARVEQGGKWFMDNGCYGCHTVGKLGTPIGPDLSHIGSKYTRDFLERWLRDPALQRPSAHMPRLELSEEQVRAVAAYLASLK